MLKFRFGIEEQSITPNLQQNWQQVMTKGLSLKG
jgi:hypothetical protein